MTVGFTDKKASRRQFLAGAAAAGAGTVAASAASATGGDPLITEIQEWAQATGDGVDATPYGMQIRFEGDVVRRNVEWLTADTISSRASRLGSTGSCFLISNPAPNTTVASSCTLT